MANQNYLYSLYDALVSINIPSDKALAVIDAMERDMSTHLATKSDLESQRLIGKADLENVRDALQSEIALVVQSLESGLAAVRRDLDSGLAAVRRDLESGLASVRQEMKSEFALLRQEFQADQALLRQEVKSDVALLRYELETSSGRLQQDMTAGFAAASREHDVFARDVDVRFAAASQQLAVGLGALRKDIVIWLGSAIAVASGLVIGAIQLA